ncbi:MAG: hypothetical protein U9M95_04810 [Candidatus Altiarchaeota archaeon]|nr:hypothetical protein [Candidatus Altiarchaeota archaeon]
MSFVDEKIMALKQNPPRALASLVVSLAVIAILIVITAWFFFGYSYGVVRISTGTMEEAASSLMLYLL